MIQQGKATIRLKKNHKIEHRKFTKPEKTSYNKKTVQRGFIKYGQRMDFFQKNTKKFQKIYVYTTCRWDNS